MDREDGKHFMVDVWTELRGIRMALDTMNVLKIEKIIENEDPIGFLRNGFTPIDIYTEVQNKLASRERSWILHGEPSVDVYMDPDEIERYEEGSV